MALESLEWSILPLITYYSEMVTIFLKVSSLYYYNSIPMEDQPCRSIIILVSNRIEYQ